MSKVNLERLKTYVQEVLHESNKICNQEGRSCSHCWEQVEAVMAAMEEEALQMMADDFFSKAKLRDQSFRDGLLMDSEEAHSLAATWVAIALGMLGDAPNYTETPLDFPKDYVTNTYKLAGGWDEYKFALTVYRAGGKTPNELKVAAEEKLQAAEARIADLEGMLAELED